MSIKRFQPCDFQLIQSRSESFLKLATLLIPLLSLLTTCDSSSVDDIPAADTSADQIQARLSEEDRVIPAGLMCFNVNSVRVKSWQNPDLAAAIKRLSPQELRIPGGEVANYWDWKRGGLVTDLRTLPGGYPAFLRAKERQYVAGKLENIKVGLQRTQTAPIFVLNMLSSTLESQLDMLNRAEALGIPVRAIELGNEFYFGTPNHRAVFPSPKAYARIASEWIVQLKLAFPDADISVVGVDNQGLEGYKKFKSRRRNWNRLVLPATLETGDAATFHIYTNNGLDKLGDTSDQSFPFFEVEDVAVVLGEPFRYWDSLKKGDEFRAVPEDKAIWITEYNLLEKIQGDRDRPPRVIGSWTHGLYALAMSLLFLEDPRISKICNHVLVGSSQFAAIYADETSFINPTAPTRSEPNGLSATGHSLQFLGKALNGATSAQKIIFEAVPYITGNAQFQYPALYGWLFQADSGQKRAILMNLSNSPHEVDVSQIFQQGIRFEQVHAPPRTLVYDDRQLSSQTGSADTLLALPPLSITLAVEDQ